MTALTSPRLKLLRFAIAGRKHAELHAAGKAETPEAIAALIEMLRNAPEDFVTQIHGDAVELGLLPATPDYCTADGEAVYDIWDIARRAGVSDAEATRAVEAVGVEPVAASEVYRRN